jgi:uncharacterized membrane protein YidH (DUF202 family)
MTGTLYIVFVIAAFICVVAGVTAVLRTRRRVRADEINEYGEDYPETTYAEESAAVAAAEAAMAAQAQAPDEEPEDLDP